jgi:hypothetical protein
VEGVPFILFFIPCPISIFRHVWCLLFFYCEMGGGDRLKNKQRIQENRRLKKKANGQGRKWTKNRFSRTTFRKTQVQYNSITCRWPPKVLARRGPQPERDSTFPCLRILNTYPSVPPPPPAHCRSSTVDFDVSEAEGKMMVEIWRSFDSEKHWKSALSLVMAPFGFVDGYRRFGGTCCQREMEATDPSQMSITVLSYSEDDWC